MDKVTSFFTPANRRRLYLFLLALVPLATLYGWLSEEQAAAWVAAGGAILGFGTAAVNTPVHKPGDESYGRDATLPM